MADTGEVGYPRLYGRIMRMSMQGVMSFRLNFWSFLVSVTLKEAVQIALLWVVLERFQAVGGWTVWEVGFLYSLNSFCFRTFTIVLGGGLHVSRLVISGRLDEFLTTPRNPLFLLNAHHSSPYRLPYNVSIFVVVVVCAGLAGVRLSLVNVLLFVLFTLSASVILFSVFLIAGSLAFWLHNTQALTDFIMNSVLEYLRYPIHIYGSVIAFLLTVIVPVAFVNYYPAAVLMRKTQEVLYHPSLGYLAPLVAAAVFALAYLVWKLGLRRYTSTGT